MDAPEPTAAEVRWTFKIVGYCAIILTLALAYGILHRVNQSDDIVHIAASSADQVERLSNQLDEQNRISAARNNAAKRERDQQLAQIARLQRLQQHQAALFVKILRRNGIAVPKGVFSTPRASTTRPKAPRGHRPTSRGTPTPTGPSPSPSALYCQLVPALCSGLPLGLPTPLP